MSIYSILIRNPLISVLSNHLDGYPTPVNLTYLWGFGSLAGLTLVIQIVTGVLLAMHYAPEIHIAFSSIEHIMRDVRGGVALRYTHANGASMFFILVYVHMFRGLYYGSYFQPRANLWYSGIVIFFLMMATGFLGYVLPWGQMSFWGATVITNLFSAIPGIGNSIVQLLWGGFSVDNPTLNRFFSLHYLLPFAIVGVVLLHLILLHQNGSNNPMGISSIFDRIPFYPYFYVKDLFGFFIFIWVFSFFVIYAPNYMGHPDNYIEANPMVTPAHIVPEWYYLPFYAILRTIPDKLGGVALMGIAIAILAVLPVVDTSVFRSSFFKPLNIWLFWFFFADSLSLGWIGQEIVESPFIEMSYFITLFYFLYFIPLLPLVGFLESAVIKNQIRHSSFFFNLAILPTQKQEGLGSEYLEIFGKSIHDILPVFISEAVVPFFTHELHDEYYPSPLPDPKYNMEENVAELSHLRGMDDLSYFFAWLNIFQISAIVLFVLFLGVFFQKSSNFIRFLNKVSVFYLIFNFWRMSLDIVLRPSLTISFWYEDPVVDYNNGNEISGFIYYLQDKIYEIMQADMLFTKLFGVYALFIVAIFLYGITDRFFIANSSEIEFPILVFFIHLGGFMLFFVHNFIDFILAIETVTLASYALAAFERKNRFSTFAGVQYFILGSIPSGLLVLGMALLYKNWGCLVLEDLDLILTSIPQIAPDAMLYLDDIFWGEIEHYPGGSWIVGYHPLTLERGVLLDKTICHFWRGWDVILDEDYYRLAISWDFFLASDYFFNTNEHFKFFTFENWEAVFAGASPFTYMTVIAVVFILFNLLFKITAAPFHFWAPSVYGKAPIASVTFLSIFSKGMIFFIMFKILFTMFYSFKLITMPFLLFCSVLSILFGMIGAFSEKLIKKFFIYSSMGHVGFMLLGLSVSSLEGAAATFHYLPVYILSSFIMWFTLLHMGKENNHIIHFKNLRKTDPLLALIFALLVFSMSGIPPLGGFFIKLDVLTILMENSRFYTNYILFIFTVASFFYYLRIIKIIFFDEISKTENIKIKVYNDVRLWLISILFLILLFYLFIVQKPLLAIQTEALSAIFD